MLTAIDCFGLFSDALIPRQKPGDEKVIKTPEVWPFSFIVEVDLGPDTFTALKFASARFLPRDYCFIRGLILQTHFRRARAVGHIQKFTLDKESLNGYGKFTLNEIDNVKSRWTFQYMSFDGDFSYLFNDYALECL